MPQDPVLKELQSLGFNTSKTVMLGSTSPISQNLIDNSDIFSYNQQMAQQREAVKEQQRLDNTFSTGVGDILNLSTAIQENPNLVSSAEDPSWYNIPSWFSDEQDNAAKSAKKELASIRELTEDDKVTAAILKQSLQEGNLSTLKELKDRFQTIMDSPLSEQTKSDLTKKYGEIANYVNIKSNFNLAQKNLNSWYQNTDAATRKKQMSQGLIPTQIGLGDVSNQNLYQLAEFENVMFGSALYNDTDLEVFKNKDINDMRTGSQGRYDRLISQMELKYNGAMTAAVQDKLNTLDDQIAQQSKKLKDNKDPNLRTQYAKELNTLTGQRDEFKQLYQKVSPLSLENVYVKKFYPEVFEKNQSEKKQELYRNSGEQGWWGRAGEAGYRSVQNTFSNIFKQGSGFYSLIGADTWAFETGLYSDNIKAPSYYMGKDVNKNGVIDDYEIQRDIHNNRVTWDQVHYTTADGEGHWNLWSATEQVLPIAADVALTIAVSKGAGSVARAGGLRWANIGSKMGLEGQALTTFTKSVAPRISTLGSVTATTFPRFYAEERRNFKNDSDAFGVGLARAVVEGLSETITPDVLMFQKGGAAGAGFLDNAFGKLGSKLPFDVNRFSTKIDLLLGLTPAGSMSRMTAARLLAPTILKNTLGQATQESIEEIGSLLGNHFVDKYAQGQNFEVPQENELSVDSIQETFVSGFIPSLFIGGVSGNMGVQKYRTGTARWDIANNPETYKAIIARQVESGKLSKEEGIKKVAQVQAVSNKLDQMMPEMSNIRNLNTLLDDKEAQFNYFTNVEFLDSLLDVDVTQFTPEQQAEYDKELEEAKNTVIKTREMADKYANLTEVEKRGIIEKNFNSKIEALQNPETKLGTILGLAESMDPNQGKKMENDERYQLMNQMYEKYNSAVTETLHDRVSTFEDILLNSPEQLTLLELQVMQDRFIPVLERLEQQGSPFLGTVPMSPLVQEETQAPQEMGPRMNVPRLSQLIDAELSSRVALSEEEAVQQIAANLANPELRDVQLLNIAISSLTDEEISEGKLSEQTGKRLDLISPALRFRVASLLETHTERKNLNPNTETTLSSLRKSTLNNDYKLATKDLQPEQVNKKVIDMNDKALELAKQNPARQNFGGRRGTNPMNPTTTEEEEVDLLNYNKDVFDFFAGITQELIELEQSDLDISEKQQEKARILKEAIGTLATLQDRVSFASGLIALFPQLGNKVDALLTEENITQDFFLGLFPTAPTLSRALFASYSSVVNNEVPQNPPAPSQEDVQDNLQDSDTVNGIGSITFTNPQIELFPIVLDGNVWNVVNTSKRPKVLININGVLVPFYLTTGLGGKGLKPGWYPFFGIGKDGWMNKTNKADMETYYARYWGPEVASLIQDISEQLNSVYGTSADSFADDADPTATSRPLTTLADKVEDYINSVLSITPFSNDQTATGMRGNVEQLGREITEALKTDQQNPDEPTFSDRTEQDENFGDKVIEQQLEEELATVSVAPSNMALKIVTSKTGNVSTLSDPAMLFASNIVKEVSKLFRKGVNSELSVRAQSMMGIYEFILSPDKVERLKEFKSKKSLTDVEKEELKEILTMDGRSLHYEDLLNKILEEPGLIGTGVGTVLVDASGAPARFNAKGKQLKTKGSYFISVLPLDKSSKRATEAINVLRTRLDGTSTIAVSPVTGTLSGADVVQSLANRPDNKLYLHTKEKSETQKTEFSEYTLLTGGLYIVNNDPIVPYSKVMLPKASGADVLAMIDAFNSNTLPPGLDPDLYTNPTAFLKYLEGLIYFSEKKTGLRLGVTTKGKLAFYKKNSVGKYQVITGSAQTQFNIVTDALKNTFYSVDKNLLESNRPFKFLKFELGELKVYSSNTYEEYIRSKEFGARFSAKENETISFGGTIDYNNLDDSSVDETNADKVARLRAEEQIELLEAIPELETYRVNGKIDEKLMSDEVLAKYNEIYERYNLEITPLLQEQPEETVKQITLADALNMFEEVSEEEFEKLIGENFAYRSLGEEGFLEALTLGTFQQKGKSANNAKYSGVYFGSGVKGFETAGEFADAQGGTPIIAIVPQQNLIDAGLKNIWSSKNLATTNPVSTKNAIYFTIKNGKPYIFRPKQNVPDQDMQAVLAEEYAETKKAYLEGNLGPVIDRTIAKYPNMLVFESIPNSELFDVSVRRTYLNEFIGDDINTVAEAISKQSGITVTPMDLITFMVNYPNGVGTMTSTDEGTFYGAYNPDGSERFQAFVDKPEPKTSLKALARKSNRIGGETNDINPDELFRAIALDNKVSEDQNKKAEAWVDGHPIFKNTKLIFERTTAHPLAYASWSKAAIFLFEGANYADAYHEAWHEFSQMYLSAEERDALYAQARKIYGNLTDLEIEELLAEDFRTFALSDGKVFPDSIKKHNESKNIFTKMWDFIKSFFVEKPTIDSYFTDLYKGNLSSYSYKGDAKFKTLYSSKFKGVNPENTPFEFTFKDSAKLTDQLDSLFVNVVKEFYESQGINIVNILSSKKAVQAVYGKMGDLIDNLLDTYAALPATSITPTKQRKFDYLDMLAANYPEVIAHHLKNSTLFESNKVKNALLDEEVEFAKTNLSEFANFEAAINEKSGKTNAAPLIIAAIKTLPEYSENRRKRKDTVFGTDYLGNFDLNWDILQKTLSNSGNYEELYSRLKELSTKYLQFKPLLTYLPNPKDAVTRQSTLNFKNLFVNTFAQPYIDGYTSRIQYTEVEGGGLEISEVKIFEASNLDAVNLRRLFDQRFSSSLGPYKIIDPETGSSALNTAKYLEDFSEVPAMKAVMTEEESQEYNRSLYEFLIPLGFDLSEAGLDLLIKSDSKDLRQIVERIHSKVVSLAELAEFRNQNKDAQYYISSPLTEISADHRTPKDVKVVGETTSIMDIIKFETDANVEYVGDMRYNALGDKIWSVNPHNYMSRVVSGLNNAQVYPTLESLFKDFPQLDYKVNPAVANSPLINYLFKANGQRHLDKLGNHKTIQLANLLGIEDIKPSKTVDTISAKKHFADIKGLLTKGVEELNRLSGKSTTRSLVLPYDLLKSFEIDQPFVNQEKSEVKGSFISNVIVGLLAAEILVHNNPSSRFRGSTVNANNVPRFGFFEDILNDGLRNSIYEATKGLDLAKIKEALTSNPALYPKIAESFRKYISDNVEESQSRLKGKYPVTVDELTKYHAFSFVARIDQHKLFFGHPYFYKNAKEVEKRISAWNAFGTTAVTDKQNVAYITPNGYNQRKAYLDYNNSSEAPREVVANEQDITKINYLVLKDTVVDSITAYLSESYGNLKDAYTNSGKRQDAAAFCTMDFFKRFYAMSTGVTEDMIKEFERQDKIYALYLQQQAGEDVTEELNEKLNEGPYYKFTIKKLQYAGQNLFDGDVIPVFHKYSVKPILPSELVTSPQLAAIVEKLHLSGADYAVFESGTKISETVKPVDLYNQDGSINSNGVATGKIDMLGLKEQVLIENKETYRTIFSTQFRKLLYKDMTPAAQSLYNAYVGYIDEIVNYDKSQFLSNIEDKEKLVEFLLGELSKKNASEATKDLIKLKENGQLQFVLDSFLDRTIMESTMASSIKSSIIKQKVPGVQRVQYPVSLIRPETTLRYYDIEDGKIRQAETIISFSSAYYPLLKLIYNGKQIGEFVDGKPINKFTALQTLNTALKDKRFLKDNAKFLDQALTTVAIRVPGQGYNSMESFRVVEFLPEESGEIILVPDEMVVKSGSDYDIDKLFCYDPFIAENATIPTSKKKGSTIYKETEKAQKDLDNALAIRKELAKDKADLIKQVKAVIDKHGYNSENIKLKELRERLINLEDNSGEDMQSALDRLKNRSDWSSEESKQKADPIKKEIQKLRRLLSEARDKDLTQSIATVVESLVRIEEDIQKHNKTIKNGRASLTNNLFLNIKERLSNVEIFESLITPNSSDLIKAEAAKYERDKFKTASYTNIVSPLYQLYVHELNSFKRSLGVDAKNNTFHSLAQKAGLKIVDTYAVSTYPLRFNGIEEDSIDLSKTTDVEGNLISDLSGQMITAHVDIEKEDDIAIINFNNLVTPTANYMNMAGSTFEDIVKLINTSYIFKGQSYTSSIIQYSQGESPYILMLEAAEKVAQLKDLGYANEPALKYIYASEVIKPKKLLAKLYQSEMYLDGSYLDRRDAYGDLLRLAGFLAAKEQQDQVFKVSNNVDFDTFSPQTLESFFMWRNELKKFYLMEKPYFNLDALTFLATKTEVAGFAITQEFMDKLKPLFPVTLNPQVLSAINSISNDEAFEGEYDVLSKAFKNEYIYSVYRNTVPEVAQFEKLLEKKNLGNIFNLYNDLKARLKNKGIESNNEIFDNATFNTEAKVAWYRTGLRIPEADYTVDVLREEFEQGFSWTNPKLNPAKPEDAKLVEDMRAFFRAFAYAGIIGTQLNKRYDSYLPMIPEEIFTYRVNDLLKDPSRYISMQQFELRFRSQHPEFFGLRSTANPELKYFKDFDLSRASVVETEKPLELTTTTQSFDLTQPTAQPVTREKLFDKTDTELKFGSVVEYTPAKATAPMKFIYWGNNSKGSPRLVKSDGSKFPGNPNPRTFKVIGSYPIVEYNNVGYIVTDNGNIYSTATGDLVYQGEDNSSKVQRERILAEANTLLTPAQAPIQPTIEESIEERRNELVRSTFQDIVKLNNELRKNC